MEETKLVTRVPRSRANEPGNAVNCPGLINLPVLPLSDP